MPGMDNFWFPVFQIEAGQYCTFVISSDGSVRACGKGSYGRLGLGDSNNQSTLKKLTFEPHRAIKKVSSSKGSDGHTLAFTSEGEVFSWGDGDYGKLGHGNSSTQKYPKLIQGPLQGKVLNSCINGSLDFFFFFFGALRADLCVLIDLMCSAVCLLVGGGLCFCRLQTQCCCQWGWRALHLGRGRLWAIRYFSVCVYTFVVHI